MEGLRLAGLLDPGVTWEKKGALLGLKGIMREPKPKEKG